MWVSDVHINMAINHWLCSPLYSMLSLNITPSPPLPQTATSSMPQAAIPEAVAIAVPQAAPSMPEAVATAVPQAATSSMPKAAATAVPQASFKVGKLQKPIVYVCLPTNLDMVDTATLSVLLDLTVCSLHLQVARKGQGARRREAIRQGKQEVERKLVS